MIDTSSIKFQEDNFDEEVTKLKQDFSEEKKKKKWEKVVNALIVDGRKILLVKRGHFPFRNSWALPGGHIDKGEDEEAAVKREVFEETNLKFEPQYFGSYEECFEELGWFAFTSVFYGEFEGEASSDNSFEEEILDIKWFDREELVDLKIGFQHRKIIDEFFSENKR